uniref:Uncharacterized protein n=1 Tax=Arundo donax TaxID=35708 RepID=A0A0A9C2V2_ARUDO
MCTAQGFGAWPFVTHAGRAKGDVDE